MIFTIEDGYLKVTKENDEVFASGLNIYDQVLGCITTHSPGVFEIDEENKVFKIKNPNQRIVNSLIDLIYNFILVDPTGVLIDSNINGLSRVFNEHNAPSHAPRR